MASKVASDASIDTVLEEVPDRPLSSLYDIACLYTACDRYERLTESTVPDRMDPEAVSKVSVATELLAEEESNSIIAARIDLSGSEPTLAETPIEVQSYTRENCFQLGYLKNQRKAGAATDYSITNHSGSSETDIETIAHDTWGSRFLRGRFEEWPNRPGAQAVAEEHSDGWIIDLLSQLGEDEDAMEELTEALLESVEFEETRALVTVKIKLEPDGEFLYPGEIPVLNEAAYECRREHFRDGISMPDSDPTGTGTGFITDSDDRVTGGSPGVLGQFGKKQPELFPDLNKDDAWRSRPLTPEAAVVVDRFGSIIDEFYTGFQGVRFYMLPYPETAITPETFQRFYSDVYKQLVEADQDEFQDEVVRLFEDEVDTERLVEKSAVSSEAIDDFLADLDDEMTAFDGYDTWLRVYGLYVAKGLDPTQVFVDEPSVSLGPLTDLEAAYHNLGVALQESELFGDLIERTDYVRPSQNVAKEVLSGRWFYSTIAQSPDPDDTSDDDPSPDDPFLTLSGKLVRGDKISADTLLDLFVLKIEREFRDNQSNGNGSFPSNVVLGQYARLTALANADLLLENHISHTSEHDYTLMESSTPGEQTRESRLESFIDDHDALATPEARAVFLLGGLAGRLTAFQHKEEVSRKVVEQHPPSSITKQSIPSVASQILEKNETYAQMDERRGNMNQRYTSRLADAMLDKNPDSWELLTQEIQWLYSLGIAYGKSDQSLYHEDEESE
ncbi:TM1802 family CRISPR-associated protein [Natronolimnohabitans sp. A-GB9]|uniref:TM1802 family CRISPR-associated protein n=1 Tax=Natronolimnohabitans sp. A-GB9 TaxID=3069757 RepID=UPI0027B441AB|nr:TM1802 family CRISPR-associated protein [Natronolimnohabitans sp. A-GB9]MDQ2052831.1 TM1802 family CRISPR-associated protein [Natronolimnohabitans sp. A-GB9]